MGRPFFLPLCLREERVAGVVLTGIKNQLAGKFFFAVDDNGAQEVNGYFIGVTPRDGENKQEFKFLISVRIQLPGNCGGNFRQIAEGQVGMADDNKGQIWVIQGVDPHQW